MKKRRLNEVIDTFNSGLRKKNIKEVKNKHLVLVEGVSRKSENELSGRSDSNKKIVFPEQKVPNLKTLQRVLSQQPNPINSDVEEHKTNDIQQPKLDKMISEDLQQLKPGDYVIVEVTEARDGVTLRGRALAKTTLTEYQNNLHFIKTLL